MVLKSQSDNARSDYFWYSRLLTIEHLRRLRGLSGRSAFQKQLPFFLRATRTWRGLFSKSLRDRRSLLFSVRSFLREGIYSIVSTCREVPIKENLSFYPLYLSREIEQSKKKCLIFRNCHYHEYRQTMY